MSITPESFDSGTEVIKLVEAKLDDPCAITTASIVSRAAFEEGPIDRIVYLPRNPKIDRLAGLVKSSFNFSTKAGGGGVDSNFEWTYGVMAFVGLDTRRPRLAGVMERAFEIDPGIQSREIKKEFGDATHAFWYSIGGESLQSHLRGFARTREVRLAILGLIEAQAHLKNPQPLSKSYKRIVQGYQSDPADDETAILDLVHKTIAPKYGHRVLEALALRFPHLEQTGVIPRSGAMPNDTSDVVSWPSMEAL